MMAAVEAKQFLVLEEWMTATNLPQLGCSLDEMVWVQVQSTAPDRDK